MVLELWKILWLLGKEYENYGSVENPLLGFMPLSSIDVQAIARGCGKHFNRAKITICDQRPAENVGLLHLL